MNKGALTAPFFILADQRHCRRSDRAAYRVPKSYAVAGRLCLSSNTSGIAAMLIHISNRKSFM